MEIYFKKLISVLNFLYLITILVFCAVSAVRGYNYHGKFVDLGRPSYVDRGGRGAGCCVPNCRSTFYDRFEEKTGISLFSIPGEKFLKKRKAWFAQINKFRRKGGVDSFTITNSTKVCELHFRPGEVKVSIGAGRKRLAPGVEPSDFSCVKQQKSPPVKRKLPAKRDMVIVERSSESEYEESSEDIVLNSSSSGEKTDEYENKNELNKIDYGHEEISGCCREKDKVIENLSEENKELKAEVEELKSTFFNYKNISSNPTCFKKFTGLGIREFDYLFKFLKPGEHCDNVNVMNRERGNLQRRIHRARKLKEGVPLS